MMDAATLKARYADQLKMRVAVRRGTGSARVTAWCRGNVATYTAERLIGNIQQGDQEAIVYADDVVDGGISLPLTADDKVFFETQELAIIAPAPRRSEDGTICAYALQVRG